LISEGQKALPDLELKATTFLESSNNTGSNASTAASGPSANSGGLSFASKLLGPKQSSAASNDANSRCSPVDELCVLRYSLGCLLRMLAFKLKLSALDTSSRTHELMESSQKLLEVAATTNVSKEEKWIAPFSYYELAVAALDFDDTQGALKYLNLCKQCATGYDGENTLQQRRKTLRTKIQTSE